MATVNEIVKRCFLLDLETTLDAMILKVGMVCGDDARFLNGRLFQVGYPKVLDGLFRKADFVGEI